MNHKQGIVRRNGITLGGWGVSRPLGGVVPPVGDWILTGGVWSDSGVWINTSTWID